MASTVLIVDANPAVQAMANAALYQTVERIECRSSVEQALTAVGEFTPQLVLVASDLPDIDPASFAAQILAGFSEEPPRLILLVPSAQEKSLRRSVGQYYNEFLTKPFKSEQLRRFVSDQLAALAVGEKSQRAAGGTLQPVAIVAADTVLLEILKRTLALRACSVSAFSSTTEISAALRGSRFHAVIVEQAATSDLNWYSEAAAGRLGIITEASDRILLGLPESAATVSRPLNAEALARFCRQLEIAASGDAGQPAEPLLAGEQAILAAKLSSSIFQMLLTQEALRERNWKEASAQVSEQVLAICRDYDQS